MLTGITSKMVINTGKSKTLMPTSAATLRKIENTKPMDTSFVCPAKILLRNYFAGASVALGAPCAAGAAGASIFGAVSCSGASLQPKTAIHKEAKKIILTKMTNTFFINAYPPFTDFYSLWGFIPNF
jgi:hypothetical protein